MEIESTKQTKPLDYVLDDNQFKLYYEYFFPSNTMAQWLQYENEMIEQQQEIKKEQGFLRKREFSFTYPGDIYQRYQSFQSAQSLRDRLIDSHPEKIDIGAVFESVPNKNSNNIPLEREFVIDIDMTDYDDVRTCCSGTDICEKCWVFMKAAGHVLTKSLEEDFGFEHILYVFSGRRGIHMWACDDFARVMNNKVRSSVIDNLNLLGGASKTGSKIKKGMIQGNKQHYQFERAMKDLRKYYEELEDSQQFFMKRPQVIEEIIKSKHEDLWKLIEDNGWNRAQNSQEKWDVINKQVEIFNKQFTSEYKKINYLKDEIILNLIYPRLDVNVSKTMNHLLKSPFSVHPKTGKVCVPFTKDEFDSFDPESAPQMFQLNQYLNENQFKVDYNNCPMTKYTQIFQNFVNNYLEGYRKTAQQRGKISNQRQQQNSNPNKADF